MLEKILQKSKRKNIISSSLCLLLACESTYVDRTDITNQSKDAYTEITNRRSIKPPCPDGQYQHFEDADGDGYGASNTWWLCEDIPGSVTNAFDCNDKDEFINPTSDEICDNIDNDCNGLTDELVFKECSTKCGFGLQLCDKGSWKECNAGTFCPTGDYNCNEVIKCTQSCSSQECTDLCLNTGKVDQSLHAVSLLSCLEKNNCTELYSECVKKNCPIDYLKCYNGDYSCNDVWKCGSDYAFHLKQEIAELDKKCMPEFSDCLKEKDAMACFYDKKYQECEEKAKEEKEKKEKELDSPDDFFGKCVTKADAKAIALLYNAFICIYEKCGAMPTPNCIWNAAFTCKLAAGIEGCN